MPLKLNLLVAVLLKVTPVCLQLCKAATSSIISISGVTSTFSVFSYAGTILPIIWCYHLWTLTFTKHWTMAQLIYQQNKKVLRDRKRFTARDAVSPPVSGEGRRDGTPVRPAAGGRGGGGTPKSCPEVPLPYPLALSPSHPASPGELLTKWKYYIPSYFVREVTSLITVCCTLVTLKLSKFSITMLSAKCTVLLIFVCNIISFYSKDE